MDRWQEIDEQTVFDMTVKMYRDPYVGSDVFKVPFTGSELDHYAYEHLGSELLMYRVLDTNFEAYIEERGVLSRIKDISIPIRKDETETIY